MERFGFSGREMRFGSNQDSMERRKVSLMLQNTLRNLETTKFTYMEREKMFPEVVYKFQRRKRHKFS